jgi:transposase-like protein
MVITDVKKIYKATAVLEAGQTLESFAQAWSDNFPSVAK